MKLNYLSFPVVTKSILVISKDFHRNVAFRMELYGCEPGKYLPNLLLQLLLVTILIGQISLHENGISHSTSFNFRTTLFTAEGMEALNL